MVKAIQTVSIVVFDRVKDSYRFLVLKKKGSWVGWQFPQGGIEKGESAEEAARREMKEETGLELSELHKTDLKSDYWYTEEGEKVHKFVQFWLGKADSDEEVEPSVEHSEARWVSFEEAVEMLKYNKEEFKKAHKMLLER
ncbi:NUDIX domain-containing protein [Candidatus Woesearchaeota archaeon]|nr:NUDIX domain-containing protein [Candidatus Woesearchaeota archaeon]